MSQLGGSLFKIIWARKHLSELRLETRKYVDSHPFEFPTDEQADEVIIYPAVVTRSPEFGIAGLIGDCMNNLMAALDYVIWELSKKHAGRAVTPPPTGNDKPSFPLYSDRAKYLARTNPCRLNGYKFPVDVMDMIDAVQPHNRGYEPLAELYFLVNEDKHRLPLMLKGQVKSGDIRLTYRDADFRAASSAVDVRFKKDDPELSPYDPSAVKVNAQVTPFVALAYTGMKETAVEVTVQRIVDCVDGVVNGFIDARLI